MKTCSTFALILLLLFGGSLPAAEPVDYLRDVKPIFTKHCTTCHGAQKQRSGLRLDTAKAARAGGNSGPAIVPGKSADSPLIKAIKGIDDFKVMPPKEQPRLSAEQIAILKTWIDEGAKAPATETVDSGAGGKSAHWAFHPGKARKAEHCPIA
jgi:mono/diheme cytochrome c family protein